MSNQSPYGGNPGNPAGWVPPPQYGATAQPGAYPGGYGAGGWMPQDPKKKFGWGGIIGAFILGGVAAFVGGFFLLIIIGLAVGDDLEDPQGGTGSGATWSSTSYTHTYISTEAEVPKVAECLRPGPDGVDLAQRRDVVDCDVSHGSEIAAIVDAPGGKVRPLREDLASYADTACLLAFEEYVGAAYDESELDFLAYIPDDEAWEKGDHSVWCVIDTTGGYGDDGSVKGTGR